MEGVPLSRVEQNLTFFHSLVVCDSVRAGEGGARTQRHMLTTLGLTRHRKTICNCGSTMSPSSLLITPQHGSSCQLAINMEHACLHPGHLHQQNQDRASASLIHQAEALLISQVRCVPSPGMSVQWG